MPENVVKFTDFPMQTNPAGDEEVWVSDPVAKTDHKVKLTTLAAMGAQLAAIDPAVQQQLLSNTADTRDAVAALAASRDTIRTVKLDAATVPLGTIGMAARACAANLLCAANLTGVSLPLNSAAPIAALALVNPASSGKVVFVDAVSISAGFEFFALRSRLSGLPTGVALPAVGRSGLAVTPVARALALPTTATGVVATTEDQRRSASCVVDQTFGGAIAIQAGQALVWTVAPLAALTTLSALLQAITGSVTWWEG